MHGMRRAEVQLGDTACVIGLGLVGQLLVQLLVASGVRVFGVDTVDDRCRLAEQSGALACAGPSTGLELIAERVAEATNGAGVDHVFLAAGGSSDEPVHIAARLARDRARVVDIGKCRLDLPWNAYYEKELDVRFSRSYGPGRYDDRYELDGVDYPIGYVRWTERRNLACFLDLVARGRLNLDALVAATFPIEEAAEVYERLERGQLEGIGFLFEYRGAPPPTASSTTGAPVAVRTLRRATEVRVGFIGAGNYASSMLLPHLAKHERVSLEHVATSTSLSAVNAQRRFGFARVSTDADAVLDDNDVDVVFVLTRHHSHADLVGRALERGKAVFVEKPLALSFEELAKVLEIVSATGNDRLMVGFNRRFAPLLTELKSTFGRRSAACVMRYGVHAGRLTEGSWYADEELEGSRFVGEGGHFIDTLGWWVDGLPTEVYAMRGTAPDDLQIAVRFDEGSTAGLVYATSGNARYPKEVLEFSAEGRTARLENFKTMTVWAGRRHRSRRARMIDKGQRAQLEHFLAAVRHDRPMPISLASLAATTKATLAVARSLATGLPERL
jgi:predicted dehydrogenase